MNQRAEYLIQILEKIGAPLVSAVVEADPSDEAQGHAQHVAALLTKSVKLGIDLGGAADLSKVQDDSVRVALSAIASALISDFYKHNQKAPEDNDLGKMVSGLQSVLTFSENFTPDEANTDRLEALEAGTAPHDKAQMHVQYLHVFVPVINAIAQFAFGQAEQKLIMDVSTRLTNDAAKTRQALLPDLDEKAQKIVDLAVLKAVVALYTACHLAETKRLSSGDAAPPTDQPLSKVWEQYQLRLDMLQALAQSLMSAQKGKGSSEAPKPVESPPAKVDTPPAKAEEPQAKPQGNDNPMAMFSKPKSEGGDAASAPPANNENEKSDDGQSDSGSGGSPMSFFKKKEG